MIFIDGVIYSLQKAGGISVYFSELISRLENEEYDFIFSVHSGSNSILNEYNQNKYVSTHRCRLPISLARYLDVSIPSNTSIFHSTYYRLPIISCRSRVKIITTVHDFTYERWSSGLKRKVHHFQKKRAILNSDVIICISENTKKDLFFYIPEAVNKDVRVVYNGVSDIFSPLHHDTSTVCNNYVLFVGARSGYKNFESVVNGLSLLDDLKLVMVGGGELTLDEQKFLRAKLHGRFEHKKFVSNKELKSLYNYAFCLIYPSLYEGFGIPVIEAMKSGCPVIASNTSSLPEISNNSAILLDDISPEQIVVAIEALHNVECRKKLISNGLENAKRFSWDKTFESLKEIYLG